MKQIVVVISLVILLQVFLTGCTNQAKYPVGKDTVLLVGDGRFQLGRWPDTIKLAMYGNEHGITILDEHVTSYKKIKDTLYVIGDSYTVVYGKTNTCKLYSTIKQKDHLMKQSIVIVTSIDKYDDFSEVEKKVFDVMEKNYLIYSDKKHSPNG